MCPPRVPRPRASGGERAVRADYRAAPSVREPPRRGNPPYAVPPAAAQPHSSAARRRPPTRLGLHTHDVDSSARISRSLVASVRPPLGEARDHLGAAGGAGRLSQGMGVGGARGGADRASGRRAGTAPGSARRLSVEAWRTGAICVGRGAACAPAHWHSAQRSSSCSARQAEPCCASMCAGAVSRSDAWASDTASPASPWSTRSSVARYRVQRFRVVVSAITPAYGLGLSTVARVGAQPPEHPPVVVHRIVAFRRFDNLNHPGESRVPHDVPKRSVTNRALADPLMAVEPGPGRSLGIVEMQALEEGEPDLPIEPLPRGEVIPELAQLLERAPQGGPGARRSFNQEP